MKYNPLILLCLLSFSLVGQDEIAPELLLGSWQEIRSHDVESYALARGIAFTPDSLEILEGFFEKDSTRFLIYNDYFYKGGKLEYSLSGDSIFITNITYQERNFFNEIVYLSDDSLCLRNKYGYIKGYRKFHYELDSYIQFDQIVIYTSACYGFCPVMGITLKKDGRFLLQGEAYTQDTGLVQGRLSMYQTDFIFDKFRKVHYENLSKKYAVSVTDAVTYSATIVENGKKQLSVSMYSYSGPKELEWAFIPIENLHTLQNLKKLELPDSFTVFPRSISFKSDDNKFGLLPSESFFLWTELLDSPLTNEAFEATYDFQYAYDEYSPNNFHYWRAIEADETLIDKIETNGRYFKVILESGKSFTHDLGYNFLERNF